MVKIWTILTCLKSYITCTKSVLSVVILCIFCWRDIFSRQSRKQHSLKYRPKMQHPNRGRISQVSESQHQSTVLDRNILVARLHHEDHQLSRQLWIQIGGPFCFVLVVSYFAIHRSWLKLLLSGELWCYLTELFQRKQNKGESSPGGWWVR